MQQAIASKINHIEVNQLAHCLTQAQQKHNTTLTVGFS